MPEIPYTFERTRSAQSLRDEFQSLDAGAHTDVKVSVAGRLMLRRGQGKLAFGQLADSSGRIQLFAAADVTPNFEEFTQLSLGDWIGVNGTIMTTRKGELSVQVDSWVMLAEAQRQFPDKWHGLTDTDTRYRQRYVDLWVNDDSRRVLTMRSRMVSLMRRWLEDRDFVEVETPIFHPIPGGALAKPFVTRYHALEMDVYLRIATELYLKRLVVGGFERVFEFGKTFRNEGISPRHNPEFTMLELYQAYGDYNDVMSIVENLVAHVAQELTGSMKLTHQERELDLTPPWPRKSMLGLISEAVGDAVDLETPVEKLRQIASGSNVDLVPNLGVGQILLELYEKLVEPHLWDPVFVMDLPKEVSPLARDHRSIAGLAEHADAVIAGRELAPCYTELADPREQRARFVDQARQRAEGSEEAMSLDEDFLRALEYGMPPTGGLGLGIDRLLMLIADVPNIRDVVLFPTLRPEQL